MKIEYTEYEADDGIPMWELMVDNCWVGNYTSEKEVKKLLRELYLQEEGDL